MLNADGKNHKEMLFHIEQICLYEYKAETILCCILAFSGSDSLCRTLDFIDSSEWRKEGIANSDE